MTCGSEYSFLLIENNHARSTSIVYFKRRRRRATGCETKTLRRMEHVEEKMLKKKIEVSLFILNNKFKLRALCCSISSALELRSNVDSRLDYGFKLARISARHRRELMK